MLCAIPGISTTTAAALMRHFGTVPELIQKMHADITCLNEVRLCGTQKRKESRLGKGIIHQLTLMLGPPLQVKETHLHLA